MAPSSGSWKPEVKMAAGFVPSEVREERIWSRPLSVARRWPSSPCVSSHCLPPMRVFLSVQISLFYKDTSHTRLGLNSTDLLLTNYTCSNPVSKEGHILRLGFQHTNFGWGGIKIQSRTAIIPYGPPEERRCNRKNVCLAYGTRTKLLARVPPFSHL